MCGFGIDLLFKVAIFIIVVLVIIAMVQWALGNVTANITGSRFWGLIQILIGGVVAIIIVVVLWKLAECAGLIGGGGRMGMLDRGIPLLALLQ
jgi:hypothetical protein